MIVDSLLSILLDMLDSAVVLALVDCILADVPEVPSEFFPPKNQALKSGSN